MLEGGGCRTERDKGGKVQGTNSRYKIDRGRLKIV